MTRHPYDAEPTPARDYDAIHAHQDATRDLPIARTYLVPPIAAYDIHPKLMEAIREADARSRLGSSSALSYAEGLRDAFKIIFRESAP